MALRSCAPPALVPLSLPANIGSVRVGAFSGTPEQANAYARQIQDAIAAADRDDLIGWIVDLRSNGGGNMWPMVAGLGPILGDGPLGYFIGPTGTETLWEYRDGASRSGGIAITTVSPPYVLKRQQPRVAVLSNVGIASSGEATLIAFRQRPEHPIVRPADLRPVDGQLDFTLSDGGTFTITTSVMADRAKTRFGDSIPPDEVISDQSQTIQRAIAVAADWPVKHVIVKGCKADAFDRPDRLSRSSLRISPARGRLSREDRRHSRRQRRRFKNDPDSPVPADKKAALLPLAYFPIDESYAVPASSSPPTTLAHPGADLDRQDPRPRAHRHAEVLASRASRCG